MRTAKPRSTYAAWRPGQPYACPYPGCEQLERPVRGQLREKHRRVWLCGSCGGQLPLRTPRQLKKRREEDD